MAAFPPHWVPRWVKNRTFSSSLCPWPPPPQDLPPRWCSGTISSHPSLLIGKGPSSPAHPPAATAAQALCPIRSAVNPVEVSLRLRETDGIRPRLAGSRGAGDKVLRTCRVLRLGDTEGSRTIRAGVL